MKLFETLPHLNVSFLYSSLDSQSKLYFEKFRTNSKGFVVVSSVRSLEIWNSSLSCIRDFNLSLAYTIRSLIEKVKHAVSTVFQILEENKGYIVGPTVSLLGATIVRLSLGKRAPSAGPLYVAAFIATTILVTIWTIQFFKHPKYKKIMQDRGVKEAVVNALPFPKPKIIEPLHSRHLMDLDRIESLMPSHKSIHLDEISESETKNALTVYKQYCDWVKKKIKIDKANAETIKVLQATLSQHLSHVVKSLVVFGQRNFIEQLLDFNSKDPFVNRVLSKPDLESIYYQFGFRLATLLRKDDLVELFPAPEKIESDLAVMDALMSSNTDKVMDITTTSVIDPFKIFIYGNKEDALLDSLNFKLPPMNLMQAAVLSGDTESLKRLIASTSSTCDWSLKDSKGLSYFALAALSGSKAMWDFVSEFCEKKPLIDDLQYLYLLYATIKSDSVVIFKDLYSPLFEEELKDLTGALILDLYEKAVAYKSNQIMKHIESNSALEAELRKPASTKTIFKASIVGSHHELFSRFFPLWSEEAKNNSLAMKEVYECLLSASVPSFDIFKALSDFEKTFSSTYQPLEIDATSEKLFQVMNQASDDMVVNLLNRVSKEQLLRFIGGKGGFFTKLVCKPAILSAVLDRCADSKFLLTACAKEAIKLAQHDSLSMLCRRGVDVVRKMPDSHESLLSYVMLSLNPAMIDIILGHSPPLSQAMIAQLKERVVTLKCHKEDESASASIIRMLDAKSLERGSVALEDTQIHLALVKAGAMEFTVDPSSAPKEDSSRGLFASGLSYIGLL